MTHERPLPYRPPAQAAAEMRKVHVDLGARSYDIHIQAGLLPQIGSILAPLLKGRRLLMVTDRTVGPLFGPVIAKALQGSGFDGSLAELPPGEGAKTLKVAEFLYDRCVDAGLSRSSSLIALGGGVIGDLAGFVAATYMRGLHFVQIPTTLLAMVDASVGGKTAVDHPRVKNAIGAFHQPRAVLIDPMTLDHLPLRQLKAGLAEVIKYGVLDDAAFFAFLEANMEALLNRDHKTVSYAIQRSCEIKARIVSEDEHEREGGTRALLNYGHTFGHAVETCCHYKGYLHGEAVAIGMLLAADLSVRRGLLTPEDARRIRLLCEAAGLPVALRAEDPDPVVLHEATYRDKKAQEGQLRFVLPTAIGRTEVFGDVSGDEAAALWNEAPRLKG